MNQFSSLRKLDQAILSRLELASSLSVLLLAFGFIASMANVLTKGSILSNNLIMQRIWAWTQCIAIDASVAGTIIRTYQFFEKRSWATLTLYAILSCLLLFTAAIVSNIESIQQTLNVTLERAYIHVFVPVETLIWVRSVVIVLLIVAHALRYVQTGKQPPQQPAQVLSAITPELLEKLHVLLASISVTEEQPETPQLPAGTPAQADEETPPVALFPSVSEEERNKVIEAFTNGIQRRDICSYLHWGSAKYTTIVKPVLDAYEQQQEQTGNGK